MKKKEKKNRFLSFAKSPGKAPSKGVLTEILARAQLLEPALRLAKMGTWHFFVNEQKTFWSPVLFEIFELEPSPNHVILIEQFKERVTPHDLETIYAVTARAVQDQRPFRFEHAIQLPGSRVSWVASLGTPILDANKKLIGLCGIIEDITERKQSKSVSEQSAKLASLGEMAGGIAHEINNPLAVIRARVELLTELQEAGELTTEILTEGLDKIYSNSGRITQIVKGLKHFGRSADQDPMTSVATQVVIDDTLSLCRERFKSQGVELREKCSANPEILCRPTQLGQVVLNLLNNAFDAIVENQLTERWVQIETQILDGRLLLSVTDSGHGIPEAIAKKIMTPFFTTKAAGKGTGLGLSIARGIVESHSGTFTLDRTSKNTRFIISLPLAAALPKVA